MPTSAPTALIELFRTSAEARCQFWRYHPGYQASQIKVVKLAGEAIPRGFQNKWESLLEVTASKI
jgi:hypothetical protein